MVMIGVKRFIVDQDITHFYDRPRLDRHRAGVPYPYCAADPLVRLAAEGISKGLIMTTTFWISPTGQCTTTDLNDKQIAHLRATGFKKVGFLRWLAWSRSHALKDQVSYQRSHCPGDEADHAE